MVGVVERVDVAWLHPPPVAAYHHFYGFAHRAQVDRDVRRVRDQAAVGVEDRAGEVEALLDVDGVRGRPRRSPICSATAMNRLEKTSSSTGSASVPAAASRLRREAALVSSRSRSAVTDARQPGSTTVVARSSAMIAGPSRLARAPGRRAGTAGPLPTPPRRTSERARSGSGEASPARFRRARRAGCDSEPVMGGELRTAIRGGGGGPRRFAGDRLDGDGLDHDALVPHEEGEAGAVGPLEGCRHLRGGAVGDLDRGVGAVVAQVHPAGRPECPLRRLRGRSGPPARLGPTLPEDGMPRPAGGPPGPL